MPCSVPTLRRAIPAFDLLAVTRRRPDGAPAALAVLCAVLFLTFLDNTIVAVALGKIQPDLAAGVSALQWIVNGYALTFAALMLTFGVVGDQVGRKTVMLSGLGVFCAGSVVCALASGSGMLIAGRVVMGAGAAASEPGTLSMLRHVYPHPASRARAVGMWTAVAGLALAAGPVVGGLLVGAAGWRSIFWFNVASGVVLVLVAARVLPESADPQPVRLDVKGAVLGAAGLAAVIYAVIAGESHGYTAASVLALFAVGGLALLAFVGQERRHARPLLDLSALRRPQFGVVNVVALATYFGTFAIFFFTALYLTEVAGAGGYRIAYLFAPMTVGMIVASLLAGRWTAHGAVRAPIVTGCLLFAAGLLITSRVLDPHPSAAALMSALALAGIGIGITIVPVATSALAAVPARRSGMAASTTNTSRELGAVVGVAVLGAVVNAQLTGQLSAALHRLHIPASFQGLVIGAVEHGGVPPTGQRATAGGAAAVGHQAVVQHVIDAAYRAFGAGLHTALLVSAALSVAAAVLALLTLRGGADARRPGTSTS